MIAPIMIPQFATADEVDAIIAEIVGDLHADNERATPEALAQVKKLIEAYSRMPNGEIRQAEEH